MVYFFSSGAGAGVLERFFLFFLFFSTDGRHKCDRTEESHPSALLFVLALFKSVGSFFSCCRATFAGLRPLRHKQSYLFLQRLFKLFDCVGYFSIVLVFFCSASAACCRHPGTFCFVLSLLFRQVDITNTDEAIEVEFTYSVKWQAEDTPFTSRLEKLAGGGLLPGTFEVGPLIPPRPSKLSSICKRACTRCRSPPQKRFLVECSSPFMRLRTPHSASRLVHAMSAWSVKSRRSVPTL